MQKSFMYPTKSVFILIAILILPLSFCNAQDIWYNESTGLVESTTDKAIDLSKIVSDWKVLREKVKHQDSIIAQKDITIQKLRDLILKKTDRVDLLTDIVLNTNKEVDSLSDRQLKTALASFSRLSAKIEVVTDPRSFNAVNFYGRLEYDLGGFYILTTASTNEFNTLISGIGYKF